MLSPRRITDSMLSGLLTLDSLHFFLWDQPHPKVQTLTAEQLKKASTVYVDNQDESPYTPYSVQSISRQAPPG
jgi:hypothetical protein